MSVLVTGGAGYIGSVTVELLRSRGEEVVVLDNLSRGHESAVPLGVPFLKGDVGDHDLVLSIIRDHGVESCIHFAAYAYVGESASDPALYFENNVAQGLVLLGALVEGNVRRFVFSSTCATYGEPDRVPITEETPQHPTNPYGWTKLTLERALDSYGTAYGLGFVALRYFNAAGATLASGERHDPETHLIPNVLAAAAGDLPHVSVHGGDYPTPDGTAIRDYIHVEDLASAHALALDHLRAGGGADFLNLGTGRGHSVMEVIESARRVTGAHVEAIVGPRRAGDPPVLVASAEKAGRVLGWRPAHGDFDEIVETAWQWRRRNGAGVSARSGL